MAMLTMRERRFLKNTGRKFSMNGNFLTPKLDLSGLEEFVNESKVSEPTIKKPIVETSEAKASADKPKVKRENFGPPLIEDWISDSENEAELKFKIEKEFVKPSFAKIKFVKSKEQVKSPWKTTVKQARNMLVKVGKFTFPADFIILKMKEDNKVPLILGRPFLHIADAVIQVKQKQRNLGVGTKE
nr:reverse transcriptase domain-containing protein [Tanacetum cinerariifolium]